MKHIIAVIRTTSLRHVVQKLEQAGVKGMTISEVKGLGEEVRLNTPYSIHNRIDILVPDARADEIVNVIAEHAATGLAGDGLVSVSSVDYAVKIRNKERLP